MAITQPNITVSCVSCGNIFSYNSDCEDVDCHNCKKPVCPSCMCEVEDVGPPWVYACPECFRRQEE